MDIDAFNRRGQGCFPGLLGIEVLEAVAGRTLLRLTLRPELLAPNGYLHAGVVVTLADTACGYGCVASLPAGAQNFTTVELKSNHLGTARDGVIEAEAVLQHGGRTTQVWDATVRQAGKTLALFRCTQMLLYPKP
jgi:1,4-dihydroxy-2-naphthoyl-CoA hydrolase